MIFHAAVQDVDGFVHQCGRPSIGMLVLKILPTLADDSVLANAVRRYAGCRLNGKEVAGRELQHCVGKWESYLE